ncbi:hypothetical protein [Shewanella baltica]|uniref:hypothetical protein n=1 Tax=Shewanella baltica TaxID=62322 RepID=UPI00217CE73B|nr:hypothetical protein [Shewanella baltica]MCS6160743.1 hypothetical protein [Shewanella baltica]MCS6241408.1 hypothetical protein [Shewanella baltica]
MYILETMKSPDFDDSDYKLESDYDDLVNAIDTNLPEGATITRDGGLLRIETNLSEKELKDSMKPAFSYHFDSIRYVSIAKG